ncbi:type II toxin-antitoxin system PemK/MazF family toxin [Embleya hyalina]|uniref:Endoribonuclease EndoA n=1 Tax=Embleya hyalina TaxID=516124 RepID=A0A401Z3C8_9ACTN|nr:type II toxin-antitoxin system PemK/MazF family toxin [Embleya hyalina]GCE01340.1 endoribonuclease EndoA [Embleya hyalina]
MADLAPVIGSEQSGRRPVVVVNSPFYTSFLTTRDRGLPHHVPVSSPQSGLRHPSRARTDDVRTMSEQRLVGRPPGSVGDKEAEEIRAYVRLMSDI